MIAGPAAAERAKNANSASNAAPVRLRLREFLFSNRSPIRARLAHGAFWSVIDTAFTRGFALIASIAVARLIGREHFGEYGVVQSTMGLFSILAGMGMSVTATKYIAEFRESHPARAGRILGLCVLVAVAGSLVASIVMLAGAGELARKTLASETMGPLLRIGCALMSFTVLNGAVEGALYGLEQFKGAAIVDACAAAFGCFAIIVGALSDGIRGAVWGLAVGAGLQCIGNYLRLLRELKKNKLQIHFRGALQEWPVLAKFSMPALLAVAMAGPVYWLCSVIVVNQPSGYSEMGLFNAANQWRTAVLLLPMTLSAPFLPVLTSLFRKDAAKYFRVLWAAMAVNTGIASIVAAVMLLFSRRIMAAYGAEFAGGTRVLTLLVLSAVLTAAVWSIGQAITSTGEMWWGFALNLVWAVTLLSTLWLLRSQGAYGYALANLLAYSLHLVTSCCYLGLRLHPLASTPITGSRDHAAASTAHFDRPADI